MTDSAASSSRAGALLWLLPAAAALVMRLLSVPTLVCGGRVHFFDPDSSYHFRRVWAALNGTGIVPLHDPALAYPHGAEPIWSPFYDQTLVLLSWVPWLLGGRFGVELTLAIVPLAVFVALIGLFWVHAARTWGRGPAMVASLMLSLLPGLGMYSRFGNTDHHALEVLMAFGFFLTLHRASGGTRPQPTVIRQVLAGLLIGLMVAYWVGLVVFLFAWGLWLLAMAIRRGINSDRCRDLSVSLLVAALFLAVNCMIWGRRAVDPRLAFLSLTWSQAVMVAAAAFVTLLVAARRRSARLGAAFAASACAAVAIRPMVGGSSFLSKNDSWLSIIAEFKSPFAIEPQSWLPNQTALWLVAAAVVLAAVAWQHRHDYAARLWPWLFSAQALAMGCVQQRFGNFAVVAQAMICAELLAGLRIRWVRWCVACFLLLAAANHARQLDWSGSDGRGTVDASLVEVLDWFRENAEPMSDPLMLRGKPEYGVLARWCVGPYVLRYAQRPVVLTSHGNQVPGFAAGHEPLFAESQNEAITRCRELGIRYILIIDSMAHIPFWARHAGRAPLDYVTWIRTDERVDALVPTARYFRTLAGRLMVVQCRGAKLNLGVIQQGTVHLDPWPRFRRIHRSKASRQIRLELGTRHRNIAQSTPRQSVSVLNFEVPEVQLFEVDPDHR